MPLWAIPFMPTAILNAPTGYGVSACRPLSRSPEPVLRGCTILSGRSQLYYLNLVILKGYNMYQTERRRVSLSIQFQARHRAQGKAATFAKSLFLSVQFEKCSCNIYNS
jgi:hypothetical protein